VGIGALGAVVALALLRLIGLFTNLFYFGRWRTTLVSPAGNHLGFWAVLVPVAGALVIGLMARYGSPKIRGHGIPEAIEAILINGSRVEPKVTILKPLSSAISIGSGGPFGAEGPIIMTGGALGSLIAQMFHLTGAERKTLLVAGAAAGMSATFAAPVASILLAVELLLFEWKPRSLIPVALASAVAAALRRYLLGPGPLFPTPPHPLMLGPAGLLSCVAVGVVAGALSGLLTRAVYAAEDAFHKLPIHWMWWPAIGGLVVGVGGLIFPQALGVGYDTIGQLLHGDVVTHVILGILLVKSLIWAVSLGSGTSGGVLAPLLMIGGAMGGLEAHILPHEGAGFWPLISMAAILGGTMRSPLTGIIFALELTHDVNALLPLLLATVIAHGFTVLTLRRSILTEKISRRGLHLTREYSTDPLELSFVRDLMQTKIATLRVDMSGESLAREIAAEGWPHAQQLYPVVGPKNELLGVISGRRLHESAPGADSVQDLMVSGPITAYDDEIPRVVANRMSETGLTCLAVIDREAPPTLVGLIKLSDLLKMRGQNLETEHRRERVLSLHSKPKQHV
jgi:H+/Cl- antiporter ClcA